MHEAHSKPKILEPSSTHPKIDLTKKWKIKLRSGWTINNRKNHLITTTDRFCREFCEILLDELLINLNNKTRLTYQQG